LQALSHELGIGAVPVLHFGLDPLRDFMAFLVLLPPQI
jgi:hypothetical protein